MTWQLAHSATDACSMLQANTAEAVGGVGDGDGQGERETELESVAAGKYLDRFDFSC